jgi:hypothetical protein
LPSESIETRSYDATPQSSSGPTTEREWAQAQVYAVDVCTELRRALGAAAAQVELFDEA